MKSLLLGLLCFAFVVGMAAPSEAGPICGLINKIAECPSVRKLKAECRAKKAAKKMKAKKPLCARLKQALENSFGGDCDCDCDADAECGCD